MDLADRLTECIKDKDVSPYEVSINSGVSEATISRILNRVTKKAINKNIKLLAYYFQVNENWLRKGKGEKQLVIGNTNNPYTNSDNKNMEDQIIALKQMLQRREDEIMTLNTEIVKLKKELESLGKQSAMFGPGDIGDLRGTG